MAIILRATKGAELTIEELDGNFDYLEKNPNGILIPKTQNKGILIDPDSPDFGWADILGTVFVEAANPTAAGFNTYKGGLKGYQFNVGDEAHVNFHIPHDYVMGSDMYIHVHWSHNSTLVTGGSVTWGIELSYAKGHDQEVFGDNKTVLITENASLSQYRHMIAEEQMSISGGAAAMLDTDLIEVDGIIMCRLFLSSNDMTSSGAVPDPFAHFVDIHYQSTGVGTKQKAPDFWT